VTFASSNDMFAENKIKCANVSFDGTFCDAGPSPTPACFIRCNVLRRSKRCGTARFQRSRMTMSDSFVRFDIEANGVSPFSSETACTIA
jgi:hypothetical protein